jgi:hypothetical protein
MKVEKRRLHRKIGGIIANRTKGGVIALTGPAGVDHMKEYKCILHNREGYDEFYAVEQNRNVLQILYRQKKDMEKELKFGKLFIKGMDVFKVLRQLKPNTRIRFIDLDFCKTYKELKGLELKIVENIVHNTSLQSPFWLAITFCRRGGDYIGTSNMIQYIKRNFVRTGYVPGEQYEFPYKDYHSPPMLTWLGEWRTYK